MMIIVRAELVSGVSAVFVSCPLLTRQILASEGRYPVHLVPQAWTVFNTRHHRKRGEGTHSVRSSLNYLSPPGLFFLDGEEWWAARRQLNPLFLKQQSLQRLHSVVEDNTQTLIGGWSSGDNIVGLEAQLYSWSTSTMLGTEDLTVELFILSSSRYSVRG